MKIYMFGTSHGVPSTERYCSAALLETGTRLYLIDAGAPVTDLMLRGGFNLNRLRAVFTTHIHGDHTNGLLHLCNLSNWHFINTSFDVYMTEQKGIDAFRNLIETLETRPLDAERIRFRLMTPETVYDDGFIRVTPIPTAHMFAAGPGHPSYAYKIECEGKTVLFSGDLSQKLAKEDFPAAAMAEKIDVMLCEMAHFSVEDVTPYLEKFTGRALYFTHVYPVEKLEQIETLDGNFGYPVSILHDGDVIEV